MSSTASPYEFIQDGLPGFNLPLNYRPARLFRTAIDTPAKADGDSPVMRLITKRELTMLRLMDAITDKNGWEKKIFDDEITGRWISEMMTALNTEVTEKMADWIIKELRHRSLDFEKSEAFVVFEGDVVKSDTAISLSNQAALQAAARVLEDVPEVHKDYHPGSDQKVLDLVHPSLFPLVYGRSRILPNNTIGFDDCIQSCGKGITLNIRSDSETGHSLTAVRNPSLHSSAHSPYSHDFQWLPSDVKFDDEGKARFTSYINNLHPQKYSNMYPIIEDVIQATIPLWNTTLTFGRSQWHINAIRQPYERISYDKVEYDIYPDDLPDEDKPQQRDDEDEDDFWERMAEWEDSVRRLKLPEPGDFVAPPNPNPEGIVDLIKDYAKNGLQIIVKLANIELTPDKPEYEGGAWHVEGQMNEHICATAIYYYDVENMTESRLGFRQQSDTWQVLELDYPQDEHSFLKEVYGINDDIAVQEIGSVACKRGRLLTFPNILQHRVHPFKLVDPTKPGHRKILALFLVDPNIKIISTANMPPQQRDWWSEEVQIEFLKNGSGLAKLSTELKDKVFMDVDDFPIGMDEAKEIRLKLMEERSTGVYAGEKDFERTEFSLCEH